MFARVLDLDSCINSMKISKIEITLTMIMSKLLAKWSGSVLLETSSSDKPLNRSCFFRSLDGNCFTVPFKISLKIE